MLLTTDDREKASEEGCLRDGHMIVSAPLAPSREKLKEETHCFRSFCVRKRWSASCDLSPWVERSRHLRNYLIVCESLQAWGGGTTEGMLASEAENVSRSGGR